MDQDAQRATEAPRPAEGQGLALLDDPWPLDLLLERKFRRRLAAREPEEIGAVVELREGIEFIDREPSAPARHPGVPWHGHEGVAKRARCS